MKPPRFPIEDYCACAGGHHIRRYLPEPETEQERALIDVYDANFNHPDVGDLAEAILRFTTDGPTEANFVWARQTDDRIVDRFHGRPGAM